MLVSLCLLAVASSALGAPVAVTNSWPGGFQATIDLTAAKAYNGWKLELTCTGPISQLEIWTADISETTNGGARFVLANKPGVGILNAGGKLTMTFVARVNGANPSCNVNFLGEAGGQVPAEVPQPQPGGGQVVPQFPASAGKYNYNEVITKSILFYEAQRSGKLPANNRIPWRGDSALQDKGQNGEDLTGGWYDAGDHVKFGFPMAYSVTVLAWGLLEYADAYRAAGQYNNMLDCIRWPLEYFRKAHVSKYELYGQVGDGNVDHSFWGRPEDMTMARPASKITSAAPGSDLAGETAAAMAAGYLAFKDADPTFAASLLQHAKDLYEFAEKFQGSYVNAIPVRDFYNSWSGYQDELAWGAAWLYRATNDAQYLTFATKYATANTAGGFSWDDKLAGYQLLLYQLTKRAAYATPVQAFLDRWLPGGGVFYTPKGFAYGDQWGPARHSANTAFLALIAADQGLKPAAYRNFATSQIHYLLGDTGRSYVVGFGNNPPNAPHHRSSSCPNRPARCGQEAFNNPGPNPQILYGALVGGPDRADNFVNNRGDYVLNEVATDYNAAFQGAVAGLKHLELAASG